MTTLLINYSLTSAVHQSNAHAGIHTCWKKKIVAYKSNRQFFEMYVREICASIRDDAEDAHHTCGCEVWNSGKEI